MSINNSNLKTNIKNLQDLLSIANGLLNVNNYSVNISDATAISDKILNGETAITCTIHI